MVRSDDDTWNITENVGSTALQTAIVRAREATEERPLFRDPYAQRFVDAAVAHGWTPPYHQDTVAEVAAVDPALSRWVTAMQDWTCSRTKFIDDFFMAAGVDGIRQAVIVAAGLDARAWRLPWPDGTTVYEIDQPGVLDFKAETLRADGAEPTATQVAVPVDLRQDWPKKLRQNGFDTALPTAWSVEGLLPYLPPAAQDSLFERINELSAPDSRLAVDAYTAQWYDQNKVSTMFDRMAAAAGPRDSQLGDHLLFAAERTEVAAWLVDNGWSVGVISGFDAMKRNGRPAAADVDTTSISSNFIEARRGAATANKPLGKA